MKKKYLDGLENPHLAKIYKTFSSEIKVADDTKRTLIVTISTPNADRSNDTMNMKGMEYKNFIKNPVVLFAHDYKSKPIAKCVDLRVTDEGVLATVEFPPEGKYAESDIIYWMYKEKYLSAWSIGFMGTDYDVNKAGGYDFKSWELFEFSSVPVPDNPEALTVMRSKGIEADDEVIEHMQKKTLPKDVVIDKGVIGYKKTAKAPEDEAWDGAAEVKKATVDDLKVMCTWYDSDNADNKSAYKLPHHKADGDHEVVWNGVKAAGAAVQGARSKLDVPDADLAGIKEHLAKHYKEFGKTAPWEDDGKAINEETVEKKDIAANDSPVDEPISGLTVGQLKDLLADVVKGVFVEKSQDDVDNEAKKTPIAEKKDVDDVVQLAYVLDSLSWFIYVFEQDDMNQADIDKLNQALGLVLQVVQSQAELGKKSLKLSDIPDGKENIKILIKAGRTISSKHEDMLNSAVDYMTKGAEQVTNVLKSVTTNDNEGDQDDVVKIDDSARDDKSVEEDQLVKIANALKTSNQQTAAVNQKQDKTLTMLEIIAGGLGGGDKK